MNSKFSLILKHLFLDSYFNSSNACLRIQELMNNLKIKNSRNKDHTKISESTVYRPVLANIPTMDLDIYWSILATFPSVELDIYRPVLATVPNVRLDIYRPVLATVPSVELDISRSVYATAWS